MIIKNILSVAAVALLTLTSAAQADLADSGDCKLTNIAANKVLFHGKCFIHQSKSGNTGNTIVEIKMGSGESFLFAGKEGSSHWMHGAENVKYTDNGKGGAIFVWDKFALAVAAD